MSTCKHCKVENELDTWYEAPKLEYLVCPRCAGDIEYSRPITMGQMAERILELTRAGSELLKSNQELTAMARDSPDLAKQLRRLVREAEQVRRANEQVASMLTKLTDNLSPRWVFVANPETLEGVKRVMRRMATEAGPGAILRVTEEEMDILKSIHRL